MSARHTTMIEAQRRRRCFATLLVLAALLAKVRPAQAWGREGHEVVAVTAEGLLTPRAREQVQALLAVEPGASLASISNWADATRNRTTAPWHYVNLPRDGDCLYMASRDCPDGNCIVAALHRQVQRLTTSPSPSERLEALKYVVHFVADLHQPLHASFADDRGGNDYQVQALGRGTNLHSLWDTYIPQTLGASPEELAKAIQAMPAATASTEFSPEEWARESCRIVSGPDFYPPRRVGAAYLTTQAAIAGQRLQLAAIRLAALLNQVLDR